MIEVLKQALEALEIAAEGGGVNFHAYANELRQAIAELESQEPVGRFAKFTDGIWREVTDGSAGVPLYTRPPQRTKQEPVAWSISPAVKGEDGRLYAYTNEKEWALSLVSKGHEIRPLVHGDTDLPQRTEPPDWFPAVENILNEYGLQAMDFVADFKEAMKDAEQSQRTWVGLTSDEILDLFDINNVYGSKWIEFARCVEAKLKDKNCVG